jgi:Putative beta-barrel porin 2
VCNGATPRHEKNETTRWQRDVTDEDCCVFEPHSALANQRGKAWRRIAAVALLIGYSSAALAEEPPLTVPKYALPRTADGAIDFNGWLLYPAVRAFTVFSDNLYQSAVNPISVAGIGLAPSLIAEWTNGIHRTTLYGNFEVRDYTQSASNTFDRQAGFVQRYEAMRDLMFTVQGDYTHKTNSSELLNSLPDAIGSPGSTLLPNGNTLLPNGTIVSPNGQPVSASNQVANVAVGGTTITNPYNQFTAQASVYKIFNLAFVRLSGSVSQTNYENQTSLYPDFTVKTFAGSGGYWFSPLFYVYSDGALSFRADSGASQNVVAVNSAGSFYRAVVGVGSAQIGLFSGSLYVGNQGSEFASSGTAGGSVFGGRLSYYPTRYWTWTGSFDQTTNISSQITVSNLALNIAGQSPLLVPLGVSTRTDLINLQTDYAISQQFSVTGRVGYTRVQYLDSTRLDQAYLAYAALKYQIRQNIVLNLEYQYSPITSTAPLSSSTRNYLMAGATYKF